MQKRRMPRNVKRASGAVVCAGLLLSGCSGHPLADTAREALQAVTAGEALPAPLAGHISRIGLEIGRQSLIDASPAANTDARVIKVYADLDTESSKAARNFTNLQVTARILTTKPQ